MSHRMGSARTHLEELAARQHSVFSRAQAREAGLSDRMIDRRLADGQLVKMDRAVFLIRGAPVTWESRLMAACLAGPAVGSHRAAGKLWRFPHLEDAAVEVAALRHRRRRASDVSWHESYHLGPSDVTAVENIPVTRPVRTFIDLGLVLAPAHLEEVLDDGLHRNLLSIGAIWDRLDKLGPLRRGSASVRRLLRSRVAGERAPESVLETRFRQLIRDAGLAAPVPQYEIPMVSEIVARVDFAYPERKLAIELDGAAYHSSALARRRDRTRENRLVALGWRVMRFGWDDVHREPQSVITSLSHALRSSA